jgi:hypothetical protein
VKKAIPPVVPAGFGTRAMSSALLLSFNPRRTAPLRIFGIPALLTTIGEIRTIP